MKRKAADCMALVVAELIRGPATIGSLCVAIGASPSRSDRVQVYLRPLREIGAIRICGWVNRKTPILGFQTFPHALPDEPMPDMWVRKPRTARRMTEKAKTRLTVVRKLAPIALGPNSVFALGAPS